MTKRIEPRYEMTPANLEEAIAMAEASTPLCRWGSVSLDDDDIAKVNAVSTGEEVFVTWVGETDEPLYAAITGNGPTSEANARFFAHARDIVLALAKEVLEHRANCRGGRP